MTDVRLLGRDCWESPRDDNIDVQPDELGGELAASFRPAILDPEVAALDPAEFAEPLHKGGDPSAPGRGRGRAQDSDGRQLSRLLRAPQAAKLPSRRRAVRWIRDAWSFDHLVGAGEQHGRHFEASWPFAHTAFRLDR
jgi:hypothetical protein